MAIDYFSRAIDSDPSHNILQSTLTDQGYNLPQEYMRTIDNHPGVLVVGDDTPTLPIVFQWEYFLDNRTKVAGWSGLKWDGGTLQFLKTLHVERWKH